MRIETERLIIRNFEKKDRYDLGEYMLQRVNKVFEGYPDFEDEAGNPIYWDTFVYGALNMDNI